HVDLDLHCEGEVRDSAAQDGYGSANTWHHTRDRRGCTGGRRKFGVPADDRGGDPFLIIQRLGLPLELDLEARTVTVYEPGGRFRCDGDNLHGFLERGRFKIACRVGHHNPSKVGAHEDQFDLTLAQSGTSTGCDLWART